MGGHTFNLWFTENGASKVGRVTPSGTLVEFPLSNESSQPEGITGGPDGNVWFVGSNAGAIGRITPGGAVTTFFPFADNDIPTYAVDQITTGPDGNLWFTELYNCIIGKITPDGAISQVNAPNYPDGEPLGIVTGSDGNLWFTDEASNQVIRSTTSTQYTQFTASASAGTPFLIAGGPDGNLWFTENAANKIAKLILYPVCTTDGGH